jgi:PAS domain S-box-containing protein
MDIDLEHYAALQAENAALQAENAALRERVALYSSSISQLPLALHLYALEDENDTTDTLHILDVNNAAECLTGRAATETIGGTFTESFPELHQQGIHRKLAEVVRTGEPLTIETVPCCNQFAFEQTMRLRAWPLFHNYLVALFDVPEHTSEVEQELRTSEAISQTLMNNTLDAVILLDTQYAILAMNDTILQRFGIADSFVPGSIFIEDLFPPDVVQRRKAWLDRAVRLKQMVRFEDEYNGRYFDSIFCPIFDEHGNVIRVSISARDITDRRQLEDELRESKLLLQSVIDRMPASVFVKDAQRRYLLVNKQYERLLHIRREQVIGRTNEELLAYLNETHLAGADRDTSAIQAIIDTWFQEDQTVLITGKPFEVEEVAPVNGEIRSYLALKFPIYDLQGDITALGGISTDITERKRAEAKLRQAHEKLEQRVQERTAELSRSNAALHEEISERVRVEEELTRAYDELGSVNRRLSRSRDLLRTMFDGLKDGFALLDGVGVIQTINRSLAMLLNSTPEQLTGLHWLAICESMEPPLPGSVVLHTLNDYQSHSRRERITDIWDRVHILDMQTLPLLGPNGTVDRVILHTVDMTERLEFEELAIQHEKFAASGRLAATVAHEVNTPLQAIQNFLYLAGQASADKRDAYLTLVSDEIDRIGSIVRQLLDLYRSDDHAAESVDLNVLVSRVLLLMGGTLAKARVTVERQLAPDIPPFPGRGDQLTQVLLNLVMNAVDAMKGGGTLYLSSSLHTELDDADTIPLSTVYGDPLPPMPYIVLEITDTGSGMPLEVKQRIFDSFFTTKPDGTGLGLAISRKIIGQHDGAIDVRSTPGEGSTFIIFLPLHNRHTSTE